MSKHKHNWLNFLYESVKKPNEIVHEFFHEEKKIQFVGSQSVSIYATLQLVSDDCELS